MRIYVGHCKDYDFVNGLYLPLRNSRLNSLHEIVLPHEKSDKPYNSKELMKSFHLMVAEVSIPATGLGIELGWADAYGIPILAIWKRESKLSGSVKKTAQYFLEYGNSDDMIDGIEAVISIMPRPLDS